MKLLIVGGDTRMHTAGYLLKKEGYDVEHLAQENADCWQEKVSRAEVIILPYPYSQKEERIPGYEHGGVDADNLLRVAKPEAFLFFGRGIENSSAVRFRPQQRCKNYEEDPLFVQRNTELSAEAAVSELMQRSTLALDEQNILVLGYGLFAKAIVRKLKALGARVWVAARKEKARLAAAYDGALSIDFDQLHTLLPQMHAVMNTVPSIVMGREALMHCSETLLLMELASPPYGIDLSAAVEMERNVVVLPGLPARYAPLSAGAAVAASIIRQLAEVKI